MKKGHRPQFVLLIAIWSLCWPAFGQKVSNFDLSKPFAIEENRGQLADEKGKLLPEIKYYGKANGAWIYCKGDRIAWVFEKATPTVNSVSLRAEKSPFANDQLTSNGNGLFSAWQSRNKDVLSPDYLHE